MGGLVQKEGAHPWLHGACVTTTAAGLAHGRIQAGGRAAVRHAERLLDAQPEGELVSISSK